MSNQKPNCFRCRDTGRRESPGVVVATVGVGTGICPCPAGDPHRAHDLVMALHVIPGVQLMGDGTAAAAVVLGHLTELRQALGAELVRDIRVGGYVPGNESTRRAQAVCERQVRRWLGVPEEVEDGE